MKQLYTGCYYFASSSNDDFLFQKILIIQKKKIYTNGAGTHINQA